MKKDSNGHDSHDSHHSQGAPRLPQRLLLWFASAEDASLVGDLAEQFHRDRLSVGPLRRRLRYISEVAHAIPVLVSRRAHRRSRRPAAGLSLSSASPGARPFEGLLHDLRQAFRTVARAPAATAVALLTLALGVGVNAAVFTIVDGVLFRPLPYADRPGSRVTRSPRCMSLSTSRTSATCACSFALRRIPRS